MKVNFTGSQARQEAVRPQQDESRQSKPEALPIFRWVLRIGIVLTLLGVGWFAWRSGRVHTYGVVCAQTHVVRSPVRGRIDAWYVAAGDRVRAGDVLCVVVGDGVRAELRQVEEELRANAATAEAGAPDGAPAATFAISQAGLELTRLQEVATIAQTRRDQVSRLVRLGAATAGDERSAASAANDATHRLDLARLEVARLERAANAAANAANARADGLQARITQLRRLAGPSEVRSPVDGVVADLPAGAGEVGDATVLATIAESGRLWIEAYPAATEIDRLRPDGRTVVHLPTGGTLTGTIAAGTPIEFPMPDALRDRLPRQPRGRRVRVDVPTDPGLALGMVVQVVLR